MLRPEFMWNPGIGSQPIVAWFRFAGKMLAARWHAQRVLPFAVFE